MTGKVIHIGDVAHRKETASVPAGRVVSVRKGRDWAAPHAHEVDEYIGGEWHYGGHDFAQSDWRNPFKLDTKDEKRDGTPEEVCEKYYRYLTEGNVKNFRGKVYDGRHLLPLLPELAGKTLGCWCAGDPKTHKKRPDVLTAEGPIYCHGQVLLRLIEEHLTYRAVAACDADYDFIYDGSEDSILFILEPDGTHTIPKRDVDRVVEVYSYPRLWPEISDEHRAMRPAGPRYAARAILYKEFGRIPKPKYSNEHLTGRLYSGGQPLGGTYLPTGFGGYAFLPYDPHPSARLPKMKREKLPKARDKMVRRKWAHPRPKWKIDREMVRAAVKRERLLWALDRERPVTYAAYTDKDGKKVREPSHYKPRPTTQIPRHPDYWVAYWEQWERRMGQLRRGALSSDPREGAKKIRNYIESRLDELRYRNEDIQSGRERAFWGAVFHRYWQQYDYACLSRRDEVTDPEEVKRRYFEQTLPTEEGWRSVCLKTMEYVECYPVVHVLSAFHAGGVEAKLSAIECAGRRLKMYGDLKKAARALMVTKPEIVAERLPAATHWAVENFDGDILSFMVKVVSGLDAPTRRAGRKASEDAASSEAEESAHSLDAMKEAYDYEPEIEEGVYGGDPEGEPDGGVDPQVIIEGRLRYAELRSLVGEHLKGNQQQWALLKLSGVDSTEELCKEMGLDDPNKLKRTAYAARAKLKKENRVRALYEGDPEFSDVARLIGGGVRVPHKAGRGKAPRDLRVDAKRTQGWPVVGKVSEERLARMGETVRLHRVRRRMLPERNLRIHRDRPPGWRKVEYIKAWYGMKPVSDSFLALGPYPTTWPLLEGINDGMPYDHKRGSRQNAGEFLKAMDREKGTKYKRTRPLAGMAHKLKSDAAFKDYATAEKEMFEDGNYA